MGLRLTGMCLARTVTDDARTLGRVRTAPRRAAPFLSFSPDGSLCAVAGAEGLVTLFGMPSLATVYGPDAAAGEEPVVQTPLASVAVHRRWISDVQWVESDPGSDAAGRLLLSASDDGTLVLSRCEVEVPVVRSAPGAVMRARVVPIARLGPELHRAGLYAMEECAGSVATCSKDGSVALSALHPSAGLAVVRTYPNVAAVRFAVRSPAVRMAGQARARSRGGHDFLARVASVCPGVNLRASLSRCVGNGSLLASSSPAAATTGPCACSTSGVRVRMR